MKPYQYIPVDGRDITRQQLFYLNYYSGSEARVYIQSDAGYKWLADCKQLQFRLHENVLPIFGYASYTVDAWARGTRLVSGMFTVNMKHTNYLQVLLEEYVFSKSNNVKEAEASKVQDNASYDNNDYITFTPSEGAKYKHMHENYEVYIDKYYKGAFDTFNNEQGIAQAVRYDLDTIPFFKRTVFNILITYRQNKLEDVSQYNYIQSIDEVQLTSIELALDVSGRPIEQVYTFLAKDYNATHRKLAGR